MGITVQKVVSSYKTSIVLLLVYALALALATFVEKYHGTEAAKMMIYYSPWLILLQFFLVLNFCTSVHRYQLLKQRRWGFILVHFSFIIILAGALTSHLTGEEGYLHIREGESSNELIVNTSKGMTTHDLPFFIELEKFTLTRYPGSSSPSSYESDLLVHVDGEVRREKVFMNNVLDLKGYRFFQASYDSDELGTILSVNRDVAGRNITYTGYLLLLVGFLLGFVDKKSRLRTLGRQLKKLRESHKVIVLLIAMFLVNLGAEAKEQPSPMKDAVTKLTVDPVHAERFGSLPMQSLRGRMMPVNTFSSEILRKIYKSDKIGSFNSDQFIVSLLALPDMWMRVPVINNPNDEVASYFSLSKGECAYIEMFNKDGEYKLENKVLEAYSKEPAGRNSFDREIIKLDEKVNIFHQLLNGQLVNIFPKMDDPDHKWYASGDDLSAFHGQDSLFVFRIMDWYAEEVQSSLRSGDWTKPNEILDMIVTYQNAKNTTLDIDQEKIAMEVRYNKMEVFRYCKIAYLILGGLLLLLALISLFKDNRWIGRVKWIFAAAVLIVFHFQMMGMGMRWYIGGYAPWSNSYETMVYVAWATITGGLLFMRRSTITFALATLFAGIVLFVSGLNWMDPQINPLVPVLKSPWLMFHVAVIVAAYGFFGISFLIGITNLVLMSVTSKSKLTGMANRIRELSIVNEMSLLVGLALMTIGTFLGAVWANESWGRYWGWDPKETWALITIIVYVLVTHLRLVKKTANLWIFNLTSIIAFASVLMTFFGVNYFLSGMHSYGQTDGAESVFAYMALAGVLVAILGVLSRKGQDLNPYENK